MAFDGFLMWEISFCRISIQFGSFVAFGFMAFDGFTGFESHQKPQKAIRSHLQVS